jgi:outer membrane protein assembly factor BamA
LLLFFSSLHAQKLKHLNKPKVAAVPLVSYNNSFGGIFGGFASVFFPMSKSDTISPPSTIGAGGFYSTNGTWLGSGSLKLYYSKDLLRTVVMGGRGDVNFQYYYAPPEMPGLYFDYSTQINFFYLEQLIRVYKRLFVGAVFTNYHVQTTFEQQGMDTTARNYRALGVQLTYDSRDNLYNPSKGWYSNARLNRFDKALGSSTEYTKLDIGVSRHSGKDPAHIFAYQFSLSTAIGSVPFEGETVVGGKLLRGYSQGKYRGEQVYVAQAEYRWNFHGKFGAVFFAGVATPVNKDESWSTDLILPAGGAGIRYMMIPDMRLNIGFDAAVGKGDYGIYFRIGEAF